MAGSSLAFPLKEKRIADASPHLDPRSTGADRFGGCRRFRRVRSGAANQQAQAGSSRPLDDAAAAAGGARQCAGDRRRRHRRKQDPVADDGRGAGQRPRPLPFPGRQRRRHFGRRPPHRPRSAAAARHSGDPQQHDRPQHRRSGPGRRADDGTEHDPGPARPRASRAGSGRGGHDRHRRPGSPAADDGFRKTPDQG